MAIFGPFLYHPATRDTALFLPYRSVFQNINSIVGLPTLVFRLMGREIAVEHEDSVSHNEELIVFFLPG